LLCTVSFTSSSVESYEGLVDISKEHASYANYDTSYANDVGLQGRTSRTFKYWLL